MTSSAGRVASSSRTAAVRDAVADPRRLGVWAVVVGVLAVATSAAGSWIPSLWGDEAASLMSATRPLSTLWPMLGYVDAVHGLYYLGLHAWVDVFGPSTFSIRFPSALAIGVCASAVVWLCGRFGSLRFAVLAGVFAALLPRLTYAGEEARSYAFAAAFAAVACAILVEIARREGRARGWWIAYAAVLTAGIWTFLYFALLVCALAVTVFCSAPLRQRWRAWAVSTAAGLALASPLAWFGFLQRRQIAFIGERDPLTAQGALVEMWFQEWWFAVVAWALVVVAAVAFGIEIVRARRSGETFGLRLDTLAFSWTIVPMGLLIAASPFAPGYTARYGTYSAPAVAIVLALAVRRLARLGRPRWLAAVAVVAVVAAAVPVVILQRGPYAKNESDWNDIQARIQENARPGDGIVFDDGARPSQRTRLAKETNPAAFRDTRDLLLRTHYTTSYTWYDQTYGIPHAAELGRFDGVSRVWVVELRFEGVEDTWGLDDLAALGFHETRRIDGAGSVILLYER
ncbi:glycosyltransferase family 39 protein [Microbacterium capsulatum]|uniref:Glycosyltransferase family 39 protein n=1 Tax=Microbacterium capsulatum TaxID=3041921 RepID=A0ABU0XFB9_9MICO|nr:glycosyltransferase family 39 protein [Microbacterium sp. ASV81]MDQ4213821.1 glycosyltransferase family 39 protein [Microbacterium sp. ASV81]